jgi:D-arabinose 1-dehydrogenase-like Zn-dependent alcohol dehydrogenase
MSYPKTCKAAIADKAGDKLTIREIEVKEPQTGEILIKVHACGVCHSDAGALAGAFGPAGKFPMIPGHEIVGTVVAVGPSEKKWKTGDLVGAGWHGAHDGSCRSCNRGLFQMCDNEEVNGVSRFGGCESLILYVKATVDFRLMIRQILSTAFSVPKLLSAFPLIWTRLIWHHCFAPVLRLSTGSDKWRFQQVE